MVGRIVLGGLLAGVLVGLGAMIGDMRPLSQSLLFSALQVASIGGAALGLAGCWRRARLAHRRVAFFVAALCSWRVAYFPVMVFSGHLASLGEWILIALGLPIVIYPTFLLAVATLHAVSVRAASWLVTPPVRAARVALIPVFLAAAMVSFVKSSDLTWLPDTVTSLRQPVPPLRSAQANPYLKALVASGYWPNQRVVLLAAGLTYETIPPSPWASAVKGVLEGLFEAHPRASTMERVREHYRAYHAAHVQIGCRRLADCPLPRPAP